MKKFVSILLAVFLSIGIGVCAYADDVVAQGLFVDKHDMQIKLTDMGPSSLGNSHIIKITILHTDSGFLEDLFPCDEIVSFKIDYEIKNPHGYFDGGDFSGKLSGAIASHVSNSFQLSVPCGDTINVRSRIWIEGKTAVQTNEWHSYVVPLY